jgi:hypothetical protein
MMLVGRSYTSPIFKLPAAILNLWRHRRKSDFVVHSDCFDTWLFNSGDKNPIAFYGLCE